MVREDIEKIMHSFVDLWVEKGYREQTAAIAGTIAGCKEMHQNYGDTLKGFEALIEFTNVYDTEEEIIEAIDYLSDHGKFPDDFEQRKAKKRN